MEVFHWGVLDNELTSYQEVKQVHFNDHSGRSIAMFTVSSCGMVGLSMAVRIGLWGVGGRLYGTGP